MDKAVAAKVVDSATRVDFGLNQVVMIVPFDSTLDLRSVEDLSKTGVKRVTLGNPASVPVGRYTDAALKTAGFWKVVHAKGVLANTVRQGMDYVDRGDIDGGFW